MFMVAGAAHAQLFRTYLSSAGNDSNPCTLTAPCRLLPAALDKVSSGGEVWMLDSANYNTGTVDIGKSVSILAVPGVVGSFVAQNGGAALTITGNGLTVALRNVSIGRVATATAGTFGVDLTGESSLTIEGSVIDRLPFSGVRVLGTGSLQLINTTIRYSGQYAVQLSNGAEATIVNANIVNNSGGVNVISNDASRTSLVSISDSFISGVDLACVRAATTVAGAEARVFVTRSTIERSASAGVGLRADSTGGTASVTISSSTVAGHTNAWNITGTGAAIFSLGDNHIRDYVNAFGSLTSVALQ
jgi:hypothetical protein